jgi:geranyl-CoA carboxylase alpha subunit
MGRFSRVLVANRGEIACRVIASARAKGYATVAVVSEADRGARHEQLADQAVVIGPGPAAQSYLDPQRIIAAAVATGAQAIHPGYGFLSENADFARACAKAGLVFIGPTPEAIAAMGDKAESKRRMVDAGVPCVPGYHDKAQDDAALTKAAKAIGYPVMVKASAGGGGRGMRLVETPDALAAALASARSEAKNAFGDDTLLLERAIVEPRHVEIQVFGDEYGSVIHLGERDCSVQRRHQKVVEEAPSPAVDAELRARMGAAAVKAAQAIGYVGAGTVEFLLGADGAFYFLEMNTRLQVEHPVTEMITGLDLVAWQLDIAQGRPLPLTQDQVAFHGHAIEVRLYAEDPAQGFLPQTGVVRRWAPAGAPGVRVDHGLVDGAAISPFYDPMIAKIVAHGADRDEALLRLTGALEQTAVLGVTTNKAFLREVLTAPAFAAGQATTGFIARQFPDGWHAQAPDPATIALAAALFVDGAGGGWRSNRWSVHPLTLVCGEQRLALSAHRDGAVWLIDGDAGQRRVRILSRDGGRVAWRCDGQDRQAHFALADGELFLDTGASVFAFSDRTFAPPRAADEQGDGVLRAPMSGAVVSVNVAAGDRVTRGQVLLVLEAMKMEHQIVARFDGVVETLPAALGAQVAARDVLAVVKATVPA